MNNRRIGEHIDELDIHIFRAGEFHLHVGLPFGNDADFSGLILGMAWKKVSLPPAQGSSPKLNPARALPLHVSATTTRKSLYQGLNAFHDVLHQFSVFTMGSPEG